MKSEQYLFDQNDILVFAFEIHCKSSYKAKNDGWIHKYNKLK